MSEANQTPVKPQLYINEIDDKFIQTNFRNLQDFFRDQKQVLDFEFFEVIFSGQETNRRVKHGLKRIPLDLIRTQITGTGIVTVERNLFDVNFMYFSSTGRARIRFYAGTYIGSDRPPTQTGTEVWSASLSAPTASAVYGITTVENNYTVVSTDQVLLCSSPNGVATTTITLPDVELNLGRQLIFKKIDNNAVALTIQTVKSQTIDFTATSYALANYKDFVNLIGTSEGWIVAGEG